jgi:putative PIN family toxin of toxin-antitoxin system
MTLANPEKVVFDCPVYAQALINPRGPAAACLTHVQAGRLILFLSGYVLQEIRELPRKLKPKIGVTPERVEALIRDLGKYALPVDDVPELYLHPIDRDDSHYVNLALATNSRLIVTRDGHLLNLMDAARPEAKEFQRLFPTLVILTPDALASRLRTQEA